MQLGQDVRVERVHDGRLVPVMSHLLKLFPIDPGGSSARAICALDSLQPEDMRNDIHTSPPGQGRAAARTYCGRINGSRSKGP